jgi:hypothetical protein
VAAADERATFAFDLEGNITEQAPAGAEALEQMREALRGDIEELRNMNAALRQMNSGGVVNIAIARQLRDQIAAQKAKVSQTTQGYIAMGGSLRNMRPPQQVAVVGMKELATVLQRMGGSLGGLVSKLGAVRGLLVGGAVVGGVLAIAAALALMTVAGAAAIVMLTKYAIAQADARRSEHMRLEGLTKIRHFMFGFGDGMRRAADSANFLQAQVDRVSDIAAIGRDKILGYTEQLYKMGLRGGNLQAALEGTAITAAVQGDEQASRFANWAAGANMTGQSVRRLADDVKARLGGIAARQMLTLSVQSQKMRENFARLFGDLNVEPLLKALSGVLEIFSQTTVTGRSLKAFIEGFFQPIIDSIGAVGPVVKRFFQGMLIAFLRIGIVVLQARNWFRDTFGDVSLFKGLDAGNLALKIGIATVFLLVGAFVALAAVVTMIAAPFLIVGGAAVAALSLIHRTVNAVRELGWRGAADAIIDGFVDGIKDGVKRVINAVEEMGEAAWNAFKRKVQIGSPSKLFRIQGGRNIAGSVALGAKEETPKVHRAIAEMVPTPRRAMGVKAGASASAGVSASLGAGKLAPVIQLGPRIKMQREREEREREESTAPRRPPGAPPAAGAISAQRGRTVVHLTIQNLTVGAGASPDTKEAAREVVDEIVRQLEGANIHAGGRAA